MAPIDPAKKAIQDTYSAYKQMIDADTDVTIASLDVLERINHNATNKYANIADSARGLDQDRQYLAQINGEITKYCERVKELDIQSQELEALVQEIDEWSKELEVKTRHRK